jgi:hypothetical protein
MTKKQLEDNIETIEAAFEYHDSEKRYLKDITVDLKYFRRYGFFTGTTRKLNKTDCQAALVDALIEFKTDLLNYLCSPDFENPSFILWLATILDADDFLRFGKTSPNIFDENLKLEPHYLLNYWLSHDENFPNDEQRNTVYLINGLLDPDFVSAMRAEYITLFNNNLAEKKKLLAEME